jgi:hypothetical protein
MFTGRLLRCLALSALMGLGVGCIVSPQPSPPFTVELTGDRISLTPGVELVGNVIGFRAAPGTVDPAEGQVVVTNLDSTDTPSIANVKSDGSFEVAVLGQPGQRFRFQAKASGARSEPFDIAVDSTGTVASELAETSPCLTIAPQKWAELDGVGDARSLVIKNTCGAPVSIDPPQLRRGRAGFTFSPTTAIDLADGETATITVVAGSASELEDVLFLDVSSPAPELRAITLTLPDP